MQVLFNLHRSRHTKRVTNDYGFTIVELLIVIVVIGILATISIVAYNGIQNRASDTTIRNDLTNLSKVAELYNVDNGKYPTGGSWINHGVGKFRVSNKSSYSQYPKTLSNLTACFSVDGSSIGFVSLSASGKAWSVYSKDNFSHKSFDTVNWYPSSSTAHERCRAINSELSPLISGGSYMNYNGYRDTTGSDSQPWRAWTDGKAE